MTAEERLQHQAKLEKQGQDNVFDEDGNLEDGKF